MNHLHKTIRGICTIEESALKANRLNKLHPLAKLLITFVYLLTVTSVHKYEVQPLLLLTFYPAALFLLSGFSFYKALARLKIVFSLAILVGIVNPFFDTTPQFVFYHITITGGIISLFTFSLKGFLTLMASYLLMASTTIKDICAALKLLRVPDFFLTQILLMYRYIIVVLHTVADMEHSYTLRSNTSRGIHFKHWGFFAGQLLLHSLHRAEEVYQSMLLRNYTPQNFCTIPQKFNRFDFYYLCIWCCFFIYVKQY